MSEEYDQFYVLRKTTHFEDDSKKATASAPLYALRLPQDGSRVLSQMPCVDYSYSQDCSSFSLISTQYYFM